VVTELEMGDDLEDRTFAFQTAHSDKEDMLEKEGSL
jgi:hypothetical protein